MTTFRLAAHAAAVTRAAHELRDRGHHVAIVQQRPGHRHPGDLLVDDLAWVAVRWCRVRPITHRVTMAGKRYEYHYDVRSWCLHVHGHAIVAPTVWLLMADGFHLCVPAARVQRKTVALIGQPHRLGLRSPLWGYLDAWWVVDEAVSAARRRAA